MINSLMMFKRVLPSLYIVFIVMLLLSPDVLSYSEETSTDSSKEAMFWQQRGDYNKALFYYKRALILDPQCPSCHNDIGLMQEYLGKFKEAEACYKQSIKSHPSYLPAYSNIGFLYKNLGQYALAVKYLRLRVELGRSDDSWTMNAQEELSRIYSMNPAFEAERLKVEGDDFAKQVSVSKDKLRKAGLRDHILDFESAYRKGHDLLQLKRFDEAIESLDIALSINPNSAAAARDLRRAQFERDKILLENEAKAMKSAQKKDTIAATLDVMSTQ